VSESEQASISDEWTHLAAAGPTYTPLASDEIDRMIVDSRPQSLASKARRRNHVRRLLRERAFLLLAMEGE
jgi:hypothetical protein